MKTRGLSLLLALVMVLGLLSAPAQAAEGAEEISSQAQLAEMTDGGSYILTADIVLSEWQAISFSGSLDGNGHTITLSGTPLFDTLSGTVKNLLLDGSVSDSKNAGALAYSVTGGTVQNCWSGASVSVGYIATPAGFAGKLTGGVIKSCLSTSPLKSYDKGIASTADASSRISNCYWLPASSPSGGSFAGEDNQKITADDYLVAMANLNAAHEEGLLYWTMGQDGVPRPTSEAAPEVERTQLDQAISQAAALREEEYTPRSWSALEAALQSAQAVGQDATQAEVNAAAKALTDAMAALVVRGDKTALEELCNSVRDKTDAVSGEEGICYTAESWAAFADARTAANAVLEDENADERQVLDAREALQQALEGLIPDRTGVTAEERAALGGEMEKAPGEKGWYLRARRPGQPGHADHRPLPPGEPGVRRAAGDALCRCGAGRLVCRRGGLGWGKRDRQRRGRRRLRARKGHYPGADGHHVLPLRLLSR